VGGIGAFGADLAAALRTILRPQAACLITFLSQALSRLRPPGSKRHPRKTRFSPNNILQPT